MNILSYFIANHSVLAMTDFESNIAALDKKNWSQTGS